MKNRLLLTFLCGAMSAGLMAQDLSKEDFTILQDLTSKIKNADFGEGSPVTKLVVTYDYDMEKNSTDLYGMQEVPGWTASAPSDNVVVANRNDGKNAKAAGVFAYADEDSGETGPGLGGATYTAPYADGTSTGNTLGFVGVWGSQFSYTQDVTLPAGDYLIEVKYANVSGGDAVNKSNNGFIAADGTEYLSTVTSYPVGTNYQTDLIVFRLASETNGKISLGYNAGQFGSGTAPHIFVDYVKLYSIDTKYLDAEEIEKAKAILFTLIEEGRNVGADVSESQRIYENANATLAEINAAIEKQKALNDAASVDLSAYFLKNPHFTSDTPLPEDEGITTYDYDMPDPNGVNQRVVHYYGMQAVTNWIANIPSDNIQHMASSSDTGNDGGMNGRACGVFSVGSNSFLGSPAYLPPSSMADGSKEGNILGFVTCWSGTAVYTQQVTLPKGKYTLVLSYYNSGGAQAVAKNLIGFVADNGVEYLGETTAFPVGKWTTEKVTFDLDDATSGHFSMGYTATNTGSGNMPHFFIDGISIYYVGEMSNPSLMGLTAAIATANEALDNKFNKEIKAQLRGAVDKAQALVDAGSEDEAANIEAADAINKVMADVNKSIAAYKSLNEFINGKLSNAIEKYGDKVYSELSQTLLDLDDDLNAAYQSENYTTEQINDALASFDATITEGIKKVWDAVVASGEKLDGDGIDISILFDQLAYTYSTTAQSGANVPDKEWSYGNATNFKTQYGTAEVWNQTPFTVSRTIANMPAGTYTITTKAFYRVSDNVTNYDTYQDYSGKAYVFAGANKTALTNVAEIASTESPEGLGWAEVVASSTVYHPNSQQAAYNTFEDDEYTDALQKSVKTVVAGEKGNLTFGVTSDQLEDNAWIVWYTFSIAYNAVDESVMSSELEQLIETAQNYLDDNVDDMNAQASSKLEDAISAAEDAVEGDTKTMDAAIVSLQAAIDYAKANVANMVALAEALETLDNAFNDYSATASKGAIDAYDAIQGEASDVDDLTNDEIKALIERVLEIAKSLKIPAYDDASDDNPIDFTQIIDNPDFEAENKKEGWTWNVENVSGTGDKTDGINGTKSTEFWDNTPSNSYFKIAQTLSGLPAGTYELSAWAVAAQVVEPVATEEGDEEAEEGEDVETEVGYIALFATPAGGEIASTKVDVRENVGNPDGANDDQKKWGTDADILGDAKEYSVIFTVPEDGGKVEIGFQSVGTLTTKWFVCDDFTLTYYGTESSKEVTPDEGNLVDIDGIDADASGITAIYTITGAKVSSLQKGINIVKFANGKVAKVLVK